MRKFTEKEKSSFPYWAAHWFAFNMVAILCGRWKIKYLFHDIEKPWLRLFWSYPKVREWHREHNRHHLEYRPMDKIDWEAWAIDNECGRFTKEDSPLTCREYFEKRVKSNYVLHMNEVKILKTLELLGL